MSFGEEDALAIGMVIIVVLAGAIALAVTSPVWGTILAILFSIQKAS